MNISPYAYNMTTFYNEVQVSNAASAIGRCLALLAAGLWLIVALH